MSRLVRARLDVFDKESVLSECSYVVHVLPQLPSVTQCLCY